MEISNLYHNARPEGQLLPQEEDKTDKRKFSLPELLRSRKEEESDDGE